MVIQVNRLIWVHYASLVLRILIDIIKSEVMGSSVPLAIVQLTRQGALISYFHKCTSSITFVLLNVLLHFWN